MDEPGFSDPTVGLLRELIAGVRYRDALDAFRSAERAGPRPGAETVLLAATGACGVMNLIGAIAFELGDLSQAEAGFDEALRLAEQSRDGLMVARVTNNLASVMHLREDLAGALRLYRSALAGFHRMGDRRYITETYHNLALAFRQNADLHEAERAAAEAIRHAEVLEDVGLRALAVTGRAELRVEQGEVAFARQEFDRAGRLTVAAGDAVGGAEIRRVRARAALREQDYVEAAAEAEAGRVIAEEHHSALLAAECSATAALAYRRSSHRELAETRRASALGGFRGLGAARLVERFEAEWGDSAGTAAG